jgi:micrococcal nuclease
VPRTKTRLRCLPRFFIALLLILIPLDVARADDEATVVKIVDGDTLEALVKGRKKRVRLIGIDTSELHESDKLIRDASRSECSASDLQGLGADAVRFVQRVLSPGDAIRLEYGRQRLDDYQRTLAFVWLSNGQLLNELLVCEGYAQARLHYVTRADYRARFQHCSQQAQTASKGLWSAGCWTRTRGPQPTTPRSPAAEGEVRGNRKSRIYHLPTCPHYHRMHAVNIAGFATEADAREAGYRKAKNCPD